MPKAEFGIIEEIDENTSFEYEPEQYHCTALEDEPYLDDWWGDLMLMKTFFHTLRRPAFGLARYGITIIPPCSLPQFQNIVLSDPRLKQNEELAALAEIITEAIEKKKYMIHFGI